MIITIDTGGTKTLISSFSDDGKIGDQFKIPTPKDFNEYANQLKEILKEKYSDKQITAISIALPGIIKNDIATWCNSLKWKNVDIKKHLYDIFSKDIPIFVDNDANLAGLYETRALGDIPESSLYVTVSTGIGTGFITNGHINPGLRTSEGGHALIEYDGLVQEWEKFASGRAIYETYGMYARDIKSKKVWYQVADRISRGFLSVIPITQPEVIIIGGSIGTYFKSYDDSLRGLLQERLPSHIICPKIVQARYPEQAVIYGCYEYAKDRLSSK